MRKHVGEVTAKRAIGKKKILKERNEKKEQSGVRRKNLKREQ